MVEANGIKHRGATTVALGNGYSADIYHKASYVFQKEGLATTTIGLVVRSGFLSPVSAEQLVSTGLEKSDPQHTSWIGFRKTDEPFGKYVGVAWQEELTIPTVEGDKRVLYMKLRAFEKEAQRHHLGRTAIQLALSAHSDAQILVHRTGNPAAALSWLESEVFEPGTRRPFDVPFDTDLVYPQLLLWLWSKYRIKGEVPDLRTGVSIGDYVEQNGAYKLDRTHVASANIYDWMVEGLRMDFPRGDSLMQMAEIK